MNYSGGNAQREHYYKGQPQNERQYGSYAQNDKGYELGESPDPESGNCCQKCQKCCA